MRKLFFFVFFVGISGFCIAQQQIRQYEYWFDDNYAGKASLAITPESLFNLATSIPTDGLPVGLHTFHIHFRDYSGAWSSATNQFFIKTSGLFANRQITGYEYWFDNDNAHATNQTVTANDSLSLITSINANALPAGLHTFHIRFHDNSGVWSSTVNQFFIKVPDLFANKQITGYEYWFDNDNVHATNQTVTANDSLSLITSINANALPEGLHTFHIRFHENSGVWSSTVNQFFIKPTVNITENKITAYRYWPDGEFNKQVITAVDSVNPLEINNLLLPVNAVYKVTPNNYKFHPDPTMGITITYKTPALFHIQFKDIAGQWGATSTDSIDFRYTVDVACDTLQSEIPKIKQILQSDSIHFFMVNALIGDSLVFETDKSLIIDLLDPYGKKLKTLTSVSGDTTFGGVRAKLDGAYFALVHGFGNISGDYTITYTHIAKYAVLGYNPKRVGNEGTAFIVFQGNGFTENTQIALIKGDTAIVADSILNRDLGVLGAYFNFTGASVGKYNINVNFGDSVIIVVENGLEVEPAIPSEIEIEIIGPSSVRSGTTTNYTIRCTNTGNLQIENPIVVVAVDSDDPNFIVSSNTYLDENIRRDCDSVNFDIDILNFIKSPNLLGHNNRQCKKGMFLLHTIPAYGTVELVVTVKTTGNSSISAWQDQVTINELLDAIMQALDTTQIKPAQLRSSALINWNNDCVAKSINCLVSFTLGAWGCLIPLEQIAQTVCNTVAGQLSTAIWYLTGHEGFWPSLGMLVGGSLIGVGLVLGGTEASLIAIAILSGITTGYNCYNAIVECNKPQFSPQIDITSVTSYDPNDKVGYRSPSGSRYFNADKNNFTYVINFENMATATAPAQEVVVADTLDENYFDIHSFKAGYIKIGSKIVPAPYDVQNHTWEVDMRPAMDLRTKVELTYDNSTGIAQWHFITIDPETDSIPIDPLVGFLPPNDSLGSGEGTVSFSIDLKDSIENGASINNCASIVFDYNDPILTPIWSNTKDIIAPVSTMSQPVIVSDSVAAISWQAEDNIGGSGVYVYNVFVKKAGEEYHSLLNYTTLNTFEFKYEKDIEYSFYVTATDSAGNEEEKTNIPDIILLVNSVGIVHDIPQNTIMTVYPNPSQEGAGVCVAFNFPENLLKTGQLVITTLNGSIIKTIPLSEKEMMVNDLTADTFIFTLRIGNEKIVSQKVVIK